MVNWFFTWVPRIAFQQMVLVITEYPHVKKNDIRPLLKPYTKVSTKGTTRNCSLANS